MVMRWYGMVIPEADFDDLCRRLYLQLKGGVVSREAAFDLACGVLDEEPLDERATDLARACTEEDGDPARLAEAVRHVLAGCFQPGFTEEPGWLAALEDALEVVNADMRASGLPGTGHLYLMEGNENAWVEVWDRYNSHGFGCYPQSGSDPVTALVTVADDAQDAVMHAIWGVWPVCPVHALGTHAQERDGAAVWWCQGDGGHAAAKIGQWRSWPKKRLRGNTRPAE
jgi:hypothetical protein